MFPESFVSDWVEKLTEPGDIVLDPFCGRGTTPFQSLLMGRLAIGCDVNPVACCISRAKTQRVSKASVVRRLSDLEKDFCPKKWKKQTAQLSPFFKSAFAPETLLQIIYLRSSLEWKRRKSDCMLTAILLGALHGESKKSPSYLSNQMPRTISTKPAYSIKYWHENGLKPPVRNVFHLLKRLIHFRFESSLPASEAKIHKTDMRRLPELIGNDQNVRCVITSPPYFNTTNFEEDQWLRLWFLGGPEQPTKNLHSRDDRHTAPSKYWEFISDMWRSLGLVLSEDSNVIIRIGTSHGDAAGLPSKLRECSRFSSREVKLVSSMISPIARRQTDSFRPGSKGCRYEVDCHFAIN